MLVLDEGRVIDFGTPDELRQRAAESADTEPADWDETFIELVNRGGES